MASVWDNTGGQMASTPTASTAISPQDAKEELQLFLQGTNKKRKVPSDVLAQSALCLLQRLPVDRHAVLHYYCNVFDEAAALYIRYLDMDMPQKKAKEDIDVTVLQDVTQILHGFIRKSPDSWAPVVSTWSLTLLGQISSKYARHRSMSMSRDSSLNDVLQLWMTCPPTQLLMDLATQCFAVMVGGAPDRCVDALLEASVQYSPHFDWVVARIGSCYPTTIITRVLHCGLKDFCSAGQSDPVTDRDLGGPSRGNKRVPKMASVVGILGHLASKHQHDIRRALMNLFQAGLKNSEDAMRMTTVPFLLQLASMSSMLLQVLTTDLISALKPSVLNRLHHQFLSWAMASPADYNSFLSLVVHLLTKCNIGAFDILSFMVSAAAPSDSDLVAPVPPPPPPPDGDTDAAPDVKPEPVERLLDEVQETCIELIHMLLFELQRGVHGKRRDGQGDLPLLDGLSRESGKLVPLLLESAQSKRLPWLEKLMVFTAVRAGQNFSARVLSQIIITANTPSQLALYFHLQESMEKSLKNLARPTVSNLFGSMATSQGKQLVQTLRNLERVVQGEKKRNMVLKATENFVSRSIQANLQKLGSVLQHPDISVSVAGLRLINTVGIPHSATHITVLSQLATVVTSLVFRALWARMDSQDSSLRVSGQRGVVLCQACIRQLGGQPFVQSQILHYLLAACLSQDNCELFGGRVEAGPPAKSGGPEGGQGELLRENMRIGLTLQLPRTHASVFHAGVVGQGLKRPATVRRVSKEWAVRNQDSLLETIAACCQSLPQPPSSTSPSSDNTSQVPMDTTGHVGPDPCPGPSSGPAPAVPKSTFDLSTSLVTPVLSEVAARTLGCGVVEAATVDTLYNDVTWPHPDFSKVTLERDLHVWKQMEDHPVLWSILEAVSSSSVFLYYCSPVLKSLMAKVLSTLETTRVKRMTDLPLIHTRACRLVRVLAQGKFLPAPLSSIGELFPFITPYEGYLLLVTVWRYIKENPPTLNVEQMEARKCEPQQCQVVQAVLNANIQNMGHLYPRIFNT